MHQVGAHESNELEEAVFGFAHLPQHVQEQIDDQRHSDLDADCILGTTDEVGDLQDLLHGSEEQLDLPALLIEVGNLLGGSIEIVCEDAQRLAGLGHHHDLAHRNLHRVPAVAGEACGQEADAVAQDSRSGLQRLLLGFPQKRIESETEAE